MRFLYLAPRYHTNQIPIMKGLTEHGHEVCFLSHYIGNIEAHAYVTPIEIGYSKLFLFINSLYTKVIRKNDPKAGNMKLKYGFPPMGRIRKQVKAFAPDVIIIRERSVYSILAFQSIRKYPCVKILYNQSPFWEKEIKNDFAHRLVRSLLPKVRMTPVMGVKKDGYVSEDGAIYVPFVMEQKMEPNEREWFRDGKIHIFCVGKYETRKNIKMLVEAFAKLADEFPIELTVAGECSNEHHERYRSELVSFLKEKGLEDRVQLLKNLSREQMDMIYRQSDLFVLPSTKEPASISQMEAMGYSLPVICSDKNGTACYVKHGKTGLLFKDNDANALLEVMHQMLASKDVMKQMGASGYEELGCSCSYEAYYNGICSCMERAKERK